jgi:hypothetical protein
LLAAAAAVSRRRWRDERTGPLLAVFWPAALVTAAESGYYLLEDGGNPAGIERYMPYAVPVALVLTTVLLTDRRALPIRFLAVTTGLSTSFLLMPPTSVPGMPSCRRVRCSSTEGCDPRQSSARPQPRSVYSRCKGRSPGTEL